MKAWPDCIPCMLTLAMNVARKSGVDEEKVRAILKQVLEEEVVGASSFGHHTPYAVAEIWRVIEETTGQTDPLRQEKIRQNDQALAMYPDARLFVFSAADPLANAIKLSIAGNMLDAMINVSASTPEELLESLVEEPLPSDELEEFRRRLGTASSIVFLTDNCGEVVFDRLLLQVIRSNWQAEVTVVVKEVPAVNDVTMVEALEVGLDRDCDRLLGNGINSPLPSTDLRLVSDEVRELIEKASLIVSKGIGNFELLEEEESVAGRTTYLVHAKCIPMAQLHQVPKGALILSNR